MAIEQHPFTTGRWLNNLNQEIDPDKWFIDKGSDGIIKSFGYIPNNDTKSVILGSFPIHEICSGQNPNVYGHDEFFYGSKDNHFWPTLNDLFGIPVDDVYSKITLLNRINLGITDILGVVDRNPGNINTDNALSAVTYNSIPNLLSHFPSITNVFITSGGRSAIGNLSNSNKSVGSWFKDSIPVLNRVGFNQFGFRKEIHFNQNQLNLIYLYSPSNSSNVAIQGVINGFVLPELRDISIGQFRKLQWAYFLNQYHFNYQIQNPIFNCLVETVNTSPDLLAFFNQI